MKKIVAVALVALVVLSGAFAWGVQKGPTFMVGMKVGGGVDAMSTSSNSMVTEGTMPIRGSFILDLDAPVSFGTYVGTDLRFGKEIGTGDVTVDAGFTADLAGYYRYDIDRDTAIRAGLGVGYTLLGNQSGSFWGASGTITLHGISVFTDMLISHDVSDNLVAFGGLSLGGDVAMIGVGSTTIGGTTSHKAESYEVQANVDFKGYAGVAYKF